MPITFEQALLTLEGAGPILEIAREVSDILREAKIDGAIIGGVAVGLHGYLRTTIDVNVLVAADSARFSAELKTRGFEFDSLRKEFTKRGVPVHFVTADQAGFAPRSHLQINGIRTVSLADLISLKLWSGSQNILRAKDLGDAIGLIRHHHLTKEFLPKIDKPVRDEFRALVDAIEREQA